MKHLKNKNRKTSEKVTDLSNVDKKMQYIYKFPQNKAKQCDKKY